MPSECHISRRFYDDPRHHSCGDKRHARVLPLIPHFIDFAWSHFPRRSLSLSVCRTCGVSGRFLEVPARNRVLFTPISGINSIGRPLQKSTCAFMVWWRSNLRSFVHPLLDVFLLCGIRTCEPCFRVCNRAGKELYHEECPFSTASIARVLWANRKGREESLGLENSTIPK